MRGALLSGLILFLFVGFPGPAPSFEFGPRLSLTLIHESGGVRIALRNIGSDGFYISRGLTIRSPNFQRSGLYLRVVDENEVEHPLTAKINPSGFGPDFLYLDPGQEFSTPFDTELTLKGLYGLRAGRYTVTAFYKNEIELDENHYFARAFTGVVESNTIEIDILE